jgi:cyclase
MANNPPKAWVACLADLEGDAKRQMDKTLIGKFDFSGVRHRAPTEVFEGRVEFEVGGEKVLAIETKPFHTRSDSVVFVPGRGVVHTGDLVAIDRHVGMQYPFLANLLESVSLVLSFDAEVYVTGHGPLASAADVRAFREYLLFIQDSVRAHYDAGRSVDAALDALLRNLGPYRSFRNPAALYFTVKLLYCEFAGDTANFARRNNPDFLATQWRLSQTLPQKHPDLFNQFAR